MLVADPLACHQGIMCKYRPPDYQVSYLWTENMELSTGNALFKPFLLCR